MNNSLQNLSETIKKLAAQLKPQLHPFSFVLMIGIKNQGKSTVLQQSPLEEMPVYDVEQTKVFYNPKGIIVEIDTHWVQQIDGGVKTLLKTLNRCHRSLRISGIILCIDIKELAMTDHVQLEAYSLSQIQLIEHYNKVLPNPVKNFILFTKMDSLAGFCEFYQTEHSSDLAEPLGFSINTLDLKNKTLEIYNQRFDQLLELLGQQVIKKLHPVRSTIKRSLIREFPLQLLTLRPMIQSLLQKAIALRLNLQGIYLSSAKQGGRSIDRLNQKIQHEYALTVVDTHPQASNYRSYFIEGAIKAIQNQTLRSPGANVAYRKTAVITGSITALFAIVLTFNHIKTTKVLDETSKELLQYEILRQQKGDHFQALYHLSKAENKLNHSLSRFLSLPVLNELKVQLHSSTRQYLNNEFMPTITAELEAVIANPSEAVIARYKALKIYLMLGQAEHFSEAEVLRWFEQRWRSQSAPQLENRLGLLKQSISLPLQKFPVQEKYIRDARNYLNALPASYFYYTLAKESFPTETSPLDIKGFNLASQALPVYYTKAGFQHIIKNLGDLSTQIQNDHWVLARQDLPQLQDMLTQAYCYDYVTWWKAFLKHSRPDHFQNYQQARLVYQTLKQSDAIGQLVNLVQQQTSAELTDSHQQFNQLIASQFTDLNLITHLSLRDMSQTINEMDKFMATLSFINDGGRTAFNLSKTRFSQHDPADPVSMLYMQSQRLPEPIANWAKQLADDSWVLLIKDARVHINQQWQQQIYLPYQASIAHRYPLDNSAKMDISLLDFKRFFASQGLLNQFVAQYIRPFLDTSSAAWKPKSKNDYMLPVSENMLNELMRGNIISNMFFPGLDHQLKIEFSLQKIELDPVVSKLALSLGEIALVDHQNSDSFTRFNWPQSNAKLALDSIEGNHYELYELGPWAFFRLLEKVNVLVDPKDSSSLQILFEINSNSGRYLLKTRNPVNPFTPGVLNGFYLDEQIV